MSDACPQEDRKKTKNGADVRWISYRTFVRKALDNWRTFRSNTPHPPEVCKDSSGRPHESRLTSVMSASAGMKRKKRKNKCLDETDMA